MKPFTYVIAPEGCETYLTPWKKYDIFIISPITNKFRLKDNNGDLRFSTCLSRLHTNDNWWIIPEIGQWPEGWTDQQRIECLHKAGALISIEDIMKKDISPNDFQGRSDEQLQGSYKIMNICFIAFFVLIVIAAILKGCN